MGSVRSGMRVYFMFTQPAQWIFALYMNVNVSSLQPCSLAVFSALFLISNRTLVLPSEGRKKSEKVVHTSLKLPQPMIQFAYFAKGMNSGRKSELEMKMISR